MSALLREHRAAAIVVALLAAVYVPWTWSGQLASLGGDSAVYVLAAQEYAPYLPADPVVHAIASNSQFPPLYPLLLAATGGAVDFHLAHLATTLFLLGAFIAFYAWLLALGLPRIAAAATVAVFAALPGTQVQALQLLSENLYLLLTLGVLVLLAGPDDARRYWLATLLLAAALLTRSAAVALLPAFALALVLRRPRAWLLMLPAAVAPALLWTLLHRPEHDYRMGLLEHYAGLLPEEIAARAADGALAGARGLAANILPGAPGPALAVLGFLVAIVVLVHALRGRADALYAIVYAALISVWPYPDQDVRFAWVILPVLLGAAVHAVWTLAARVPVRDPRVVRVLPWVAVAIPALLAAPAAVLAAGRVLDPWASDHPGARQLPEYYRVNPDEAKAQAALHLELAQAIRELGAEVPAGQCVISIKPAVVALLGHRDGFVPPFERTPDEIFEAWLPALPCSYVLLLAATDTDFTRPYYPRERLGDRLQVLDVRVSKRDASGRVVAALAKVNWR